PSSRRMSMMWPVWLASSTSSDWRATSIELSNVPSGSSPNALVRIGVPVRSGLTQLTRTSPAHSSANACVRLTTAALADEYSEYPPRPRVYDDDVNSNSDPDDCARCE